MQNVNTENQIIWINRTLVWDNIDLRHFLTLNEYECISKIHRGKNVITNSGKHIWVEVVMNGNIFTEDFRYFLDFYFHSHVLAVVSLIVICVAGNFRLEDFVIPDSIIYTFSILLLPKWARLWQLIQTYSFFYFVYAHVSDFSTFPATCQVNTIRYFI